MYRLAYKYSEDVIFYFDQTGNKYVASGGNLAWRINNPGLVRTHSHFSRKNGSIGNCDQYAIFSNPQDGHKALIAWLHSKKYFHASIRTLAKHYQPNSPESFLTQLFFLTQIASDRQLKSLSKWEFDSLVLVIEKICGYSRLGYELFTPLPKIIAKIENGKKKEDTYLVADNVVLSKKEAIERILSHRLDAVIVHEKDGSLHLRSRPNHCISNIKISNTSLLPFEGKIDTLVRVVGEKKTKHCIWGFINGILNSEDEAIKAADHISKAAGEEIVLSLPNDSTLLGIKDGLECVALKMNFDTPIVQWAAKFFKYLLNLSEQEKKHVVVFVHSQGAIITEHALRLLNKQERDQIRVLSFGGGSFIEPGASHVDSHNYASAADLVCGLGSPNLHYLALKRYHGLKEGLSERQIIHQFAYEDALLEVDSINPETIERYTKYRVKYYEKEFSRISNVTVLDPDSDSRWKHKFLSQCYQTTIQTIVKEY